MSEYPPVTFEENDPFDNDMPLSQSQGVSCLSYLNAVVDISDDDFDIPCSQVIPNDR